MAERNPIPAHVAIIMDGNGRWARERNLARIQGHQKGVETIREIIRTANERGIRYLTLYAFSKENWARPAKEIKFLMGLLADYLDLELKEMKREGIRFRVIGRVNDLPAKVQEKIRRNIEETQNASGLTLTLALSYSSRLEIVEGVKRIVAEIRSGHLQEEQINEAVFSSHLDTAGMPDPDLLIRTSGERRISNFLLWQISYTELYVSEKYWPDFRREDFLKAIEDYQRRERRFGKTEVEAVPK